MTGGFRVPAKPIPFDITAARSIEVVLGGTVSGYSLALDVIQALNRAGFRIVPIGDGVALTSTAHPDGLIEEIADAIRDGRLSTKPPKPL